MLVSKLVEPLPIGFGVRHNNRNPQLIVYELLKQFPRPPRAKVKKLSRQIILGEDEAPTTDTGPKRVGDITERSDSDARIRSDNNSPFFCHRFSTRTLVM